MRLKSLKIQSGARGLIREVNFRIGLNLIVDDTADAEVRRGNNVGKTTVLRCVDYCLGGGGESLYLDDEWKTPNETVHNFLKTEEPTFHLTLERTDHSRLEIVRKYGQKTWSIDGDELSDQQAQAMLRTVLFGVEGRKPSFRQLIGKFVRVSPQAKTKVMKWLDPHTDDSEYELIWLTLFGLGLPRLLNERQALSRQLKGLRRQRTEISRTAKAPKTERKVVERALAEARQQLERLAIAEGQEAELRRLGSIREELVVVGQDLARVEARLADISRTVEQLEQSAPRISSRTIRELYESARVFVPELQKSYEDLNAFHHALIRNKAAFVNRARGELEAERSRLRRRRSVLAKEEAETLRSCAAPDLWADVRTLNDRIAKLSERQGWLKGLEAEVERLSTELELTSTRLDSVESEIQSKRDSVDANVDEFNEYLADYTERISGLRSFLTLTLDGVGDKGMTVDARMSNIEGHEGSGEKRSQIIAFDLAYLRWQEERGARGIRFSLVDEVETADASHLQAIFEIAEELKGQLVLPILQDRLKVVDFDTQQCVVLRLSRADRFFRLT